MNREELNEYIRIKTEIKTEARKRSSAIKEAIKEITDKNSFAFQVKELESDLHFIISYLFEQESKGDKPKFKDGKTRTQKGARLFIEKNTVHYIPYHYKRKEIANFLDDNSWQHKQTEGILELLPEDFVTVVNKINELKYNYKKVIIARFYPTLILTSVNKESDDETNPIITFKRIPVDMYTYKNTYSLPSSQEVHVKEIKLSVSVNDLKFTNNTAPDRYKINYVLDNNEEITGDYTEELSIMNDATYEIMKRVVEEIRAYDDKIKAVKVETENKIYSILEEAGYHHILSFKHL